MSINKSWTPNIISERLTSASELLFWCFSSTDLSRVLKSFWAMTWLDIGFGLMTLLVFLPQSWATKTLKCSAGENISHRASLRDVIHKSKSRFLNRTIWSQCQNKNLDWGLAVPVCCPPLGPMRGSCPACGHGSVFSSEGIYRSTVEGFVSSWLQEGLMSPCLLLRSCR